MPGSIPTGGCLAITDTLRSDASFLLHHFLGTFARLAARPGSEKPKWRICFLSLSQSLQHWKAVARKLGWDFSKSLETGSLDYFDGYDMLAKWGEIDRAENHSETNDGSASAEAALETLSVEGKGKGIHTLKSPENPEKGLESIFNQISGVLSRNNGPQQSVGTDAADSSSSPLCIIVDDLTTLLDCGYSVSAVLELFSLLRDLAAAENGALIVLAHADTVTLDITAPLSPFNIPVSDAGSSYHSDLTALVQSIRYAADIRLDVTALSSGITRDVHGQVDIKRSPLAYVEGLQDRSFHYKVNDAGVDFFPVGFSRGVI